MGHDHFSRPTIDTRTSNDMRSKIADLTKEYSASSTWPKEFSSSTPFTLLASGGNDWHVYNRESGLISINHPELPSGGKIMRFWDQEERPDVDISPDDGRVNYDPDGS